MSRFCHACRAPLEEQARFCASCGTPVATPAAAVPPPPPVAPPPPPLPVAPQPLPPRAAPPAPWPPQTPAPAAPWPQQQPAYTVPAPQTPPPAKKSGGCGCKAILLGCLLLLLLGVAGCVGGLFVARSHIRGTETYKLALAQANQAPAAIGALGSPITESWWVTGMWSTQFGTSTAELTIPVRGPKGDGQLDVVGESAGAEVRLTQLWLVRDRERIDLLAPAGRR